MRKLRECGNAGMGSRIRNMKTHNAKNTDEDAPGARWSLGRMLIEASCVVMLTLLLTDPVTRVPGGTV
jgi:hypothetical protein